MKNPEYGLLVTTQMMGQVGRDGKRSHAIMVNSEPGRFFQGDLASSSAVRAVLGNNKVCRVFSAIMALDGANHAYKWTECPRRVACNVCNPSDPIHCAIVATSKGVGGPIVPLAPPSRPMKTGLHPHRVSEAQMLKAMVRFTHPMIPA